MLTFAVMAPCGISHAPYARIPKPIPKRMSPKPYFIPAHGLYMLSHHLENKGAKEIIKKELRIANHDASMVLPGSENLLNNLNSTKAQMPMKVIPKMILETLILLKVCPKSFSSTHETMMSGTVVSKASIILKIIAAEPSSSRLV